MIAAELPKWGLEVRLPALGPIIGWTRPNERGEPLARVWMNVDESGSAPALAALTARWDPESDQLVPNSAELWWLAKLEIGEPGAEAGQLYAVADLRFPTDEARTYRMVSVHGFRRGALEDGQSGTPMPAFSSAATAQQLLMTGAYAKWARLEPSAAPVYQPRLIAQHMLELFLPGGEVAKEALAESAFAALAERIARARATADAPGRRTLSRVRLRRLDIHECEVRLTAPARRAVAPSGSPRFAATCCRYPGLTLDREFADRALAALADLAEANDGPAFALMVGDQIYADAMGGVFDTKDRLEKFTAGYADAFGSKAFRRLARQLPLYMAPDDHEIVDGWPATRSGAAGTTRDQATRWLVKRSAALGDLVNDPLFENARRAYLGHQRLHGPPDDPAAPEWGEQSAPLWYRFGEGTTRFFVMDTRFERELDREASGGGICGKTQMHALFVQLETWLAEERSGHGVPAHAPKFIVSGSVLAPGFASVANDPRAARRVDNWQAFPADRVKVLGKIADLGLENVVFLSGDYHCAAAGALKLLRANASALRAYTIVAPPLYAPLPFVNTRTFEIAGVDPDGPELIKAGERAIAECRARAFDIASGFAVVTVTRVGVEGTPDDWVVRVDFRAFALDGRTEGGPAPFRSVVLAGGEARLDG